jgi:ABC-type dipeptide/oligopeptide/nickel transport system permease subunit
MTNSTAPASNNELSFELTKGQSLWSDAVKRIKRNRLALFCFWVIVFYIVMAVLAKLGVIAPNVRVTDNSIAYQPPSWDHWFGTDIFGRDVMAKAVHGTWTALTVGFVSSAIAIPIGVFFGALSGYFGGKVDDFVVWLYTTIDSIPYILLLIALKFVLGPGLTNAYIAIGATSWVTLCRLIRGEFFKHKNRDYVLAAQAMGASHSRRIFIHILPNVFHIILINFSLQFIQAIKFEVILSYLGLGVEPGTPSWGVMIDDAKLELARGYWWQISAATLFMFGLILAFNLFNDALRDALDPKLKNK